ncbi:DUF3973 domain-containing protein [Paenibacillus filicis]|uniref:DUF3973 domain-containing protein n=1 Tax=Paenibacillus filicis TaxID=669464 RepID=A0ABU9DLR5_9BACL
MFYCIACKLLHPMNSRENLLIFKTGFHVLLDTRYPAGFCLAVSDLFPFAHPNPEREHHREDKHPQTDSYDETQGQPTLPSHEGLLSFARTGV